MALSRRLGLCTGCGLAVLLACASVWADDQPGIEQVAPRSSLVPESAAGHEREAATEPSPGHVESSGEPQPTTKPAMQSLIAKLPSYTGDWWSRPYLSGDWGGARTKLAEHGVLFDTTVTQYLQDNAYGGKNTKGALEYGGMVDMRLKFDTARMGLWPGGLIVLHGQTQFGRASNGNTGSLMSPNFDMLLPVPGDPGLTTLSEYYIEQALSEKLVILAGKIDLTAIADRNEFAGDITHTTSFLNTAFNVNPVLFPAAPYTTLGAGIIAIPTEWLQIATAVVGNNPDGAATTTGFNTAFHSPNWLTVAQEYDITIKPFQKLGHQRIGWFWTSRDFDVFQGDPRQPTPFRIVTPGRFGPRLLPRPLKRRRQRIGDFVAQLSNPQQRSSNQGMWYNFDQYLVSEADDPTQGWGVFGRFGIVPSNANLVDQFYSIGLGGKGTIPRRDNDTWGVGYYLANTSNDVRSGLGMSSEQGVELFYNIEITPWFHLTPDLQVIVNPAAGFRDRETAVVAGLRGEIRF